MIICFIRYNQYNVEEKDMVDNSLETQSVVCGEKAICQSDIFGEVNTTMRIKSATVEQVLYNENFCNQRPAIIKWHIMSKEATNLMPR